MSLLSSPCGEVWVVCGGVSVCVNVCMCVCVCVCVSVLERESVLEGARRERATSRSRYEASLTSSNTSQFPSQNSPCISWNSSRIKMSSRAPTTSSNSWSSEVPGLEAARMTSSESQRDREEKSIHPASPEDMVGSVFACCVS